MARSPQIVLLLQGGGALGAYQAGAYAALSEADYEPDWIAGISIGAINAAILCGNPEGKRVEKLSAFWEGISSGFASTTAFEVAMTRGSYTDFASAAVMAAGVPGFFMPRHPLSFWPLGERSRMLSVYDTSPLHDSLTELVDFDFLNERGPRLSVGSVDVETGNFVYFDSRTTRIGPEHVMASGALPPGFPPVEIGGRLFWDGGLVSNTPLQYVLSAAPEEPLTIFQIDLFSARGARPVTMSDVEQREKDIRYSSRTRLTTDRFEELHKIRSAADRLARKLPASLKNDPDLALLQAAGPVGPVTLVELIHRKTRFETSTKDYEFSRLSMLDHWTEGRTDVERTLSHPDWTGRPALSDGLMAFDLAGEAA